MFKFRLEKVLRFRALIVDAESVKLRDIEQQLILAQHKIATQNCLLMDLMISYQDVKESQKLVSSWEFMHRSITEAQKKLNILNEEEQNLQQVYSKQKQSLIEAQKEKSALVKLKEHQLAKWQQEQRHREQRLMDDMASISAYQTS